MAAQCVASRALGQTGRSAADGALQCLTMSEGRLSDIRLRIIAAASSQILYMSALDYYSITASGSSVYTLSESRLLSARLGRSCEPATDT